MGARESMGKYFPSLIPCQMVLVKAKKVERRFEILVKHKMYCFYKKKRWTVALRLLRKKEKTQ